MSQQVEAKECILDIVDKLDKLDHEDVFPAIADELAGRAHTKVIEYILKKVYDKGYEVGYMDGHG